ncbi:MAG: hypothetical protein AAGC43_09680 [Bacteroidota bacterium]
MPANKKYLLQTRLGRTSKVLAAIFGGLFATISLQLAITPLFGLEIMVPTAMFGTFALWIFFMVLVYWIQKPWKAWLFLLSVIILSGVTVALTKSMV